MRYDVNSQNTKRALANGLQELAKTRRPGDTITISQLTSFCNVHRNTFYYHFSDIRELVLWTLHNDFYMGIKSLDSQNANGIRQFVADYLFMNNRFLLYAYNSLGIESFLDCFRDELYPILTDYIDAYALDNKVLIAPPFKKFVAEAFSEQIISIYMLQIRHSDRYSRPMIKKTLAMVFDYAIPNVLCHADEIESKDYDNTDL